MIGRYARPTHIGRGVHDATPELPTAVTVNLKHFPMFPDLEPA